MVPQTIVSHYLMWIILDLNECNTTENSPCPAGYLCLNNFGSFSCEGKSLIALELYQTVYV